jgi:hypothetical protein
MLGLRCSWCPGSAPMPKLQRLYALPPATGATAASQRLQRKSPRRGGSLQAEDVHATAVRDNRLHGPAATLVEGYRVGAVRRLLQSRPVVPLTVLSFYKERRRPRSARRWRTPVACVTSARLVPDSTSSAGGSVASMLFASRRISKQDTSST